MTHDKAGHVVEDDTSTATHDIPHYITYHLHIHSAGKTLME